MRLTNKHAARARRPVIRHSGFMVMMTSERKHNEWLISIPLKKYYLECILTLCLGCSTGIVW